MYSNRNITIITNFCITLMLVFLLGIAFSANSTVAFKENSNKPYYVGDTSSNKVSIMFNVYWGTEYIDGILDVLDKYDAKCTFFVGGSWVEKNSEMLKKISERGHEIGNHGYFHKDHDKLNFETNIKEIEPNNLIIEQYIGQKPSLFAPPSGAYNENTLKAADHLGMKTIMWSKDTIDWRDKDVNVIYKRATKDIKGGDLVLAHPTQCTLDALPQILKYYSENGLKVVKVSENIQF